MILPLPSGDPVIRRPMLLHIVAPLIAAIAALFVTPEDADALQRTAPAYLTHEAAIENLAAARAAGWLTGTEPEILLSIAHHESRYTRDAVTLEPGNRVSCGVMTPEPLHSREVCLRATESLAQGYLAGARHLRVWVDACHGSALCAIRGYAGCGYRRDCQAVQQFIWRALWITRERKVRATRKPIVT